MLINCEHYGPRAFTYESSIGLGPASSSLPSITKGEHLHRQQALGDQLASKIVSSPNDIVDYGAYYSKGAQNTYHANRIEVISFLRRQVRALRDRVYDTPDYRADGKIGGEDEINLKGFSLEAEKTDSAVDGDDCENSSSDGTYVPRDTKANDSHPVGEIERQCK